MRINPIFLTDSYKLTHWKQYPPGTETIYSYFESRGGKFPETVFFGLQYFLKEYLEGQFFTAEDLEQAQRRAESHFGQPLLNYEGWAHILNRHGGRLPVSIRAVPEGAVVPTRNVLMTIENTDPAVPWLTNFLETLLVEVWYPMTVATLSRAMRNLIGQFLEETGDLGGIDFKLHDFGFRGVSSVESAGLGGMAHLVNFSGTDTLAAVEFAKDYYGEEMAGFSIPASEHSTITSWGRDGEREAFANMLEQFPEGLMACVSDSFDIYAACRDLWGRDLKEKVLGRSGTLVVRPDSGYPPEIVVNVLEVLGQRFGVQTNDKGFKVLPPQVRVIQGDGVDYEMANIILEEMKKRSWSADNIAFGMGGALLQKLNRDTQKCAFKCAEAIVNGAPRPVFKDPITDPGKKSKAGRLKLVRYTDTDRQEKWSTIPANRAGNDELVEVFRDGAVVREHTLSEVRERARAS